MSEFKRAGTIIGPGKAIIVPYFKNYIDDPYFVHKADKMRELVDKYGLPNEEETNS